MADPNDLQLLRDLIANFGAGGATVGAVIAYLYVRQGRGGSSAAKTGVTELTTEVAQLRIRIASMRRTMEKVEEILEKQNALLERQESAVQLATLERREEIQLLRRIDEHLYQLRVQFGASQQNG